MILVRLFAPVAFGVFLVAVPATAQQQCAEDFAKLRKDAETRAGEVRAAGERKAEPPELCRLIRRFAEAEARMVKYLDDNQMWCQIPPDVVTQAKNNQAGTIKARNRVCSARPVAAPPPPPSGKGIGSLGSPTGLGGGSTTPTNPTTQGAGVFSTLGGAQ